MIPEHMGVEGSRFKKRRQLFGWRLLDALPKGGEGKGGTRLCCRQLFLSISNPWILSLIILCMYLAMVSSWCTRNDNDNTSRCARHQLYPDTDLPVYSSIPAVNKDRMTMMLNSFHRPDLMRRSIQHYSRCKSILEQIRVIWCEDQPPEALKETLNGMEVVYDVMNGTSLNNRFTPVHGLTTEAVLNIDDDILTPCSDIERLFEEWTRSKRALVGLFPRIHSLDKDCRYEYQLGTKTYLEGRYSMVLTKAAVFHRDYLTLYSEYTPREIREYVDAHHNCEDIAMQLLVANFTSEFVKFVNSPWTTDSGKGFGKVKGISSGTTHRLIRTHCLNDMSAMFNHPALYTQPLNSNGETLIWIRLSPLLSLILNLFNFG